MSAIWGIINKNGAPVNPDLVKKVRNSIKHSAVWGDNFYAENNAALGVCSNYVESPPIHIETEDFVLVGNARIDNAAHLGKLLNLNTISQSVSNGMLMLDAFRRWGNDCVNYLEGEYAVAIWNKITKLLFLATDHIGFRSLFYYDGPWQFIFSSEIKGVVAGKTTPNYFNEAHLIDYHFRQGDALQTYNKEVFALGGGNYLSLKEGKTHIHKYWKLAPAGKYKFKNDREWADCLRDLLYRAVEKRLDTSVPVGVTLSGGLDSTAVTCILANVLAKKNKQLFAFSSVLPTGHVGIEQDERKYIDIVNKFCPNIVQTYIVAIPTNPFLNVAAAFTRYESLPNTFYYIDEAILTSAREKGIKNLFTGYGGDFWVSWQGNKIIYQLIRHGKYKTACQLINNYSKAREKSRFDIFKCEYVRYNHKYGQLVKALKPENKQINWQKQTMLSDNFLSNYPAYKNLNELKDWASFMQDYIQTGKMGRLLGMLHNFNAFYNTLSSNPMLDKDIMEFLIEVPVVLFNKYGNGRELMRNALKNVIPEGIRSRKDKLPYAPGYHSLICKNKIFLKEMLKAEDQSSVFNKYFDAERFINGLDNIFPQVGFTATNNIVGIRGNAGGYFINRIKHLKKRRLHFLITYFFFRFFEKRLI